MSQNNMCVMLTMDEVEDLDILYNLKQNILSSIPVCDDDYGGA